MNFILYLMLFVTPAANLTPLEKQQGYKSEGIHIWTLQTVTQTQFSSHDACMLAASEIVQSVGPVMNMTVKGWCICESTGKTDNPNGTPAAPCPASDQKSGDAVVSEFLNRDENKNKKVTNAPVGFTPIPTYNPKQQQRSLLEGYKAIQTK